MSRVGQLVERHEGLIDVQRKTAKNTAFLLRYLQKSIEEAVVDCYDKAEQASGFLTVIDESLALPFAMRVLGVAHGRIGRRWQPRSPV